MNSPQARKKKHLSSKQSIIPDVSGTKNLDKCPEDINGQRLTLKYYLWNHTRDAQLSILLNWLSREKKEFAAAFVLLTPYGSTHFFEWQPK